MIRHLLSCTAGTVLTLSIVATPPTYAQQLDTVVFVHGLGQIGAHWSPVAMDLASRHPIVPYLATLDSKRTYATQASQLSTALNIFSAAYGHGAISHSNGGVVVREYVRSTAAPRLDRHLSLGSPHAGAALAEAAYDGSLAVISQMAIDVFDPFQYFAEYDPDWPITQFDGLHGTYVGTLAWDIMNFAVQYLPAGVAAAGFLIDGYGVYPDVLPNMRPGSPFLTTLNSSANVGAEAQKLPVARVSLSTQYPSDLAPYRAMAEAVGDSIFRNIIAQGFHDSAVDIQLFAMDAYWHYLSHADLQLRTNAYRWWDASILVGSIPSVWGTMTGTPGNSGDGIVPWSSSVNPGETNSYLVSCAVLCIHHREQLWGWQLETNPLRQTISYIIENDLYEDPPDPLSVSINGPTVVPAVEACSWSAQVTGGEGGTTYAWSGVLSGSSLQVSGQVQASGWLYLTVTRGTDQESDQMYVTVDSTSLPPCPN